MVARNANLAKLNAGYLFPEINKRKKKLLEKNPDAHLISLGIGDTTEPIFPVVSQAMQQYAKALSTYEGYSGYDFEQGQLKLRQLISDKIYHGKIPADDLFISDGAKCDLGRLQMFFGKGMRVALQDPAYPVYVDSSVIAGHSGQYDPKHALYEGLVYMPCRPGNHFFPDLEQLPPVDVIYFCSPNNPTGAAATRKQLEELVSYAKKQRAIIIYDAAYAAYIRDPAIPKSIYEISGAKEVAIEVGSFSKMAGFTGLRLGWSVVPHQLHFDDGSSVKSDWHRLNCTIFNGASNIVQTGGCAALSDEGLLGVDKMIAYYMENAALIRDALQKLGITVYGGEHAPYLWAHFPGKPSWTIFEELLEKCHIVTTPGVGFGPSGENFLRLTAFGRHSQVEEALKRLERYLGSV